MNTYMRAAIAHAEAEVIDYARWIVNRVGETQPTTTRMLYLDSEDDIPADIFFDVLALVETAGLIIGGDEKWVSLTPYVVLWLTAVNDWTPTRVLPADCRSIKQLHALADLGIIQRRGGGRTRLEWRAA